jgi:ubiquinone/menaquinone biosynthesis C-methylase UbiE
MVHYNQTAKGYTNQYFKEQKQKITAALNNTKLRPTDKILDVGCGTGILFQYVADAAKLVVGVDISRESLKEAKEEMRTRKNAAIILADADYTPFQNQTFDKAFAITLLQNMPAPLKTLQEIRRISTQRATMVITGLKKKFTRETFLSLLDQADLTVSTLINREMKGYLAICRKR